MTAPRIAPAPQPLDVIAEALGQRTSGGEPVTDVYMPEGLAILVSNALGDAGFVIAERLPNAPVLVCEAMHAFTVDGRDGIDAEDVAASMSFWPCPECGGNLTATTLRPWVVTHG